MKFRSALFVFVSYGLLTTPASAWVKSMSIEKAFVGENVRVHEVSVKCKLDKSERKIRKVVSDKKPWCSVGVPSMCSPRKVIVAREMCQYSRIEFQALIDNRVPQIAVKTDAKGAYQSKDDLLQEQLLIEEQRIQIAQKKIELSRKELVLRKSLSEGQTL